MRQPAPDLHRKNAEMQNLVGNNGLFWWLFDITALLMDTALTKDDLATLFLYRQWVQERKESIISTVGGLMQALPPSLHPPPPPPPPALPHCGEGLQLLRPGKALAL